VIGVIMGVGDWSDQDGEYYRHPFGNALIEKAYADYEYKKVFSKGEQEIDGETYNLPEDFYVTVKKGTEPKVKVENGVLKAENDLTTLSTLISDGMKVERVERSIAQSVKEVATGKNTKKAWYNLLINNRLLILLPVGILVLILFAENSKRKKRRAQAKTRRDRYR